MNNSIVMDLIISMSLIFIFYLYSKFDNKIDELTPRHMIALFIVNMVILNIIKLLLFRTNQELLEDITMKRNYTGFTLL